MLWTIRVLNGIICLAHNKACFSYLTTLWILWYTFLMIHIIYQMIQVLDKKLHCIKILWLIFYFNYIKNSLNNVIYPST